MKTIYAVDQLPLFSMASIDRISVLAEKVVVKKKTLLAWLSAGLPIPSIECTVFAPYIPRIVVADAHDHPFTLNEPTSFAELSPPVTSGSLDIDASVAVKGSMSIAQLDALARMTEAFKGRLADGRRAGFLFGDGTGTGKTRPLLAAAKLVANQNGQPVFVFTVKRELLEDFRDEIVAVNGQRRDIVDLGRLPKGAPIPVDPVIYFGTYATLRTRYPDIIDSMPADFHGGIFLDESQNLRRGNEEPLTERGKTARQRKIQRRIEANEKVPPFSGFSKQAMAFLKIDEAFPDAHVLMVSATAASSIQELRYMSRLGLWGVGTVFPDYESFVKTIRAAGLSGLELLAQEIASTGRSITRSLSFDGIEYEILRSPLSDEERDRYDKYIAFWDGVKDDLEQALGLVNLSSGKVVGKYRSGLTAARRQFLRMAKMRLRLNALIEDAKERIAAGESVVVQIARTQEAALKAALKSKPDDVDDSELDITGSHLVRAYLDHCFPRSKYKYDIEQNEMVVEVDPITGGEIKVKEVTALIDKIRQAAEDLVIDQSPIDTFISAMGGPQNVAEYTGRKIRRLPDHNDHGQIFHRKNGDIIRDLEDFRADKKRVLIFSEAKGGAGINMHADARWTNHRKRNHYLLELGHRADGTIQGMGRTNRTSQVHKPRYVLVYADVPADLMSTEHFALKMARLGAVTRGDRKGTNIAFFDPDSNLVDDTAQHAFRLLVNNLANAKPHSAYYPLAEAMKRRIFPQTLEIDPKKINLESFLPNLDCFPLALQEDFYGFFREITEQERETARENGATFGRVDAITHSACIVTADHNFGIYAGRPVPVESGDGPVSRLVGVAYVPKPTIVGWSDGLARLKRTTLPANTLQFGQYHDKGADLVTPAVVCGVWRTSDGNQMVNVLTPYGYHRRKLTDMMSLSFGDIEKRWNVLTAKLSKPKAKVGWIVETRILALESVRGNPTLVRLETSAGRRIFGAMISDKAARKILSSAIDPVDAYSIIADGQLTAMKLDSTHQQSATSAA